MTNRGPDLKHHGLTNTIHLTLKMTSAQVVEIKRQSLTKVLLRTALTQIITQYELHTYSADRLFEHSLVKAGV